MGAHYRDHKEQVNRLFRSARAAVDPAKLVSDNLDWDGRYLTAAGRSFEPGSGRIFLFGVGKAALTMGAAAVQSLGGRIASGLLIAKQEPEQAGLIFPPTIKTLTAAHPIPDERSLAAAHAAAQLMATAGPGDLVLCLISGGASALLSHPYLPLVQWQQLVAALLTSGCTINEFNQVRNCLDRLKGGGLARLAAPAATVALILSDVIGNSLPAIGGGPTVPGPVNVVVAQQILERYNVAAALPVESWQMVGQALELAQSEPASVPSLAVSNILIGDIGLAAGAAAAAAQQFGFVPQVMTTHLAGEAREVGRVLAALAKDAPENSCLIFGGETTVTLRGTGLGGRNQELALAAALALEGWPRVVLAAMATDGEDGPTDAAGAVATGETAVQARQQGLLPEAYLDNNDSYYFWQQMDGLIKTGPTGTNVNDLTIILKYEV